MRLATAEKQDIVAVKQDQKEMETEDEKTEELHHDEGHDDDSDRSEHEKDPEQEKHYDLKHPDIRHMSDKQIEYWANKKMKWRNDDPMNRNKVMAKIFQVKNMEAQTLTKMNEVNTQIGMNTTGVRATMLAKGENVIVNGELVKPNPSFHLNHVFQGQKGRDPQTEENGRDPEQDEQKAAAADTDLQDLVKKVHEDSEEEVQRAVAARTPPYASPGSVTGPVTELADLKKAVSANKKALSGEDIHSDDEKNTSEQSAADDDSSISKETPSLGDDDSVPRHSDEETEEESVVEREDEDALTDDNDVAEVMDENSITDDIGQMDSDIPDSRA